MDHQVHAVEPGAFRGVAGVADELRWGEGQTTDTGLVVPPRNPDALAEALLSLLQLSSTELEAKGDLARLRISDNLSMQVMIDKTAEALVALCQSAWEW